MTVEQIHESFNEKTNKLCSIEDSLPQTYHELLTNIDYFIFGAQKAFDIATELHILAINLEALTKTQYKKNYAEAFLKSTAPPSSKDHHAKAECSEADCKNTIAEARTSAASLKRQQMLEKVNSYKKIKSDNPNMRGSNT